MERYAMYPYRKVLSPSLSLSTVKTDKFKSETLSVSLITPIDRRKSPLSLLALSVLKRGTEKYRTQGEINLRLDDLYATSISIKSLRCGNSNILGFTAEMLGEEYAAPDSKVDIFDGTIDVICQMLFHPLTDENGNFLPVYTESEKSNQCDAINAQINNPRAYAALRCREIMYEGEPYGTSLFGTTEQIEAVTPQELFACYHGLISGCRYEIFYVGSREANEVEEVLRRRFLPYLGPERPNEIPLPDVTYEKRSVKRVTEEMPLAQGKLVLGFRTGINIRHPDFYAMLVMSEIYGGSPVSKLFMNVREKLSLCYYCNAAYEVFMGSIMVSCGVSPANREKAEGEILYQLKQIAMGKITDEEFEAAKHSLCNGYRSFSDSPSALETYYSCRNEFGVDCTVEKCMENIRNVSREDVIRVAGLVLLDTVYFLNGSGEENDDATD